MCVLVYDLPKPLEHPVGWALSFHFRENRDPAVPACVTGCVRVIVCACGCMHLRAHVGMCAAYSGGIEG